MTSLWWLCHWDHLAVIYTCLYTFAANLGQSCINPTRSCSAANSFCDSTSSFTCQCVSGYTQSGSSCIVGTCKFFFTFLIINLCFMLRSLFFAFTLDWFVFNHQHISFCHFLSCPLISYSFNILKKTTLLIHLFQGALYTFITFTASWFITIVFAWIYVITGCY